LETFGAGLKMIREQRGMTLEQVSLSTKISVRFLRALEEEHFEQLPGGIFNKGFVRSYARTVGMNEGEAIDGYLAATGEDLAKKPLAGTEASLPDPRAADPDHLRPPVGLPRRGLTLTMALGAVVLIASVVFLATRSRQLTAGLSAGGFGAADSNPGAEHAGSAARAEGQSASQARLPDGQRRPGEIVVKIKASDDSWLLITADGKPIMQDTLAAAEEKSITAQKEIVIKAGNVGGLEFWFNGNKLASQGEYGNVRTLTFDAGGLRAAAGGGSSSPE
jgi:hypothetical protein